MIWRGLSVAARPRATSKHALPPRDIAPGAKLPADFAIDADRGEADEQATVSSKLGAVRSVDRALVRLRPQLFGYQFLYELVPS